VVEEEPTRSVLGAWTKEPCKHGVAAGIEALVPSVDAERSHPMTLSPFKELDLVRLPDGRVGSVVGVWNLGEAYEVNVDNIRETWSADELTPTP
jgi:hypothetical protein